MAFTCKDCGIKFLSSSEFELHKQTHYQTHLDKWSSKPDKINWKPPDGLNPALYKYLRNIAWGIGQCYVCGTMVNLILQSWSDLAYSN
ncbi:MAG: C2H2-type zinc finger protein [Candidatus Nitrosopolaris sp.]